MADATSGPFFLSATASSLVPGTNYTLLASVRQGSVLSPGVTALTGLLVPDTTPPSFTHSAVLSAAHSTSQTGKFSVQMDLGLDEQGQVHYAVYGDPACITGEASSCCGITGHVQGLTRICSCANWPETVQQHIAV